jgi:hypothetical protein
MVYAIAKPDVFVYLFSDQTADNTQNDSRETNANHETGKRLKEIAKKIKGSGKWRWREKVRISKKDRQEQNSKRRVMKHFRGAKSDKVSQLSSSRLLAYGVNKKNKHK